MSARRYVWVRGPRGKNLHMLFKPLVEGELTECGRRVAPGWRWILASALTGGEKRKYPKCAQCLREAGAH